MKKIQKLEIFVLQKQEILEEIRNFLPFTEIKNFCPYKTGSFESKLRKSSK